MKRKETELAPLESKSPIHDYDLEKGIISYLMNAGKEKTAEVIIELKEEYLFIPNYKLLFMIMQEMFQESIEADLISIKEYADKKGLQDQITTLLLLETNELLNISYNSIKHHCRILYGYYIKREIAKLTQEVYYQAANKETDPVDLVESLESKIYDLSLNQNADSLKSIEPLTHELLQYVEIKRNNPTELIGIPIGLKDVDSITQGFKDGEYIIIAARPSIGKTALSLQGFRTAAELGYNAAFFSIEMNSNQLMIRFAAADSNIDQNIIKTGKGFKDYLYNIFIKTCNKMFKLKAVIDDSALLTPLELRSKCLRLKAQGKLDIVYIDYLQLMQYAKAESREREISFISQTLKQIAKELNIPVVALAQLNRSVESRTDKTPMLSDLRESGSIEQDADIIIFINRPEYYNIKYIEDFQGEKISTENLAIIDVAKYRNGAIGKALTIFDKSKALFKNYKKEESVPEHIKNRTTVVGDFQDEDPF